MHVFLAGGSGAIGRRLTPQLVARGHQVTATTTSQDKLDGLRALGAEPVVVDGLDAVGVGVGEAVARTEPDAVIHQMSALAGEPDLHRFDDWFARTNELRTAGSGSSPRATPAGRTPAKAVRSRRRRIRSTPIPRLRRPRALRRFAHSSAPCWRLRSKG